MPRKEVVIVIALIGLAVAATWANWDSGLQVIAIVNAVLAFWSNGVLANFRGNPTDAPDLAALFSMVSAAASVVLLLVAWLG